jgi:hypothetical protein
MMRRMFALVPSLACAREAIPTIVTTATLSVFSIIRFTLFIAVLVALLVTGSLVYEAELNPNS